MKNPWLILSLSIWISCKGKDDSATPNENAAKLVRTLNSSDTFLFDLPRYEFARMDTYHIKEQIKYEKSLGIQSLKNGFDSIEIRFWYGCGMLGERIISLRNIKGKWQAEISNVNHEPWEVRVGQEYLTIDSIYREATFKTPKSGWVKFIDTLFRLRILTLPDEKNIPGFNPRWGTDGCGFSVEIATKKVYRYYGFANPGSFNEKQNIFFIEDSAIWQEKNIVHIIKLLSKEFGISEWPSWSKVPPQGVYRKNEDQ